MQIDKGRQALLAVLGMSAGVATGVLFWRWRSRPGWAEEPVPGMGSMPRGSAQDVSEALRRDGKLSARRIEVDTIAEGVIELSGSVRTRSEAERAVGLAQSATGVYTVVNRLQIEEEESHRETTRRRWGDGAPELRERHHYGMGVGMGTRRQSPSTDPDRPSDKQELLDRELDVAKVEDEPESGPNPVSGAGVVDSADLKPGDPTPRESVPEDEVESAEPEEGGEERT